MQSIGLTPNNLVGVNTTSVSTNISTPAEAQSEFSVFLKEYINEVNVAQIQSDEVTKKMALGENVDLHTVMITSQKASVMLQTTIEIRNKAVEAYQEMMRMQI